MTPVNEALIQELDLVPVPQTKEELEILLKDITEKFNLPPGDDTDDAIATAILHYAQDKHLIPASYLGGKVRKMIANALAFNKTEEIRLRLKAAADLVKQKALKAQQEKEAQEAILIKKAEEAAFIIKTESQIKKLEEEIENLKLSLVKGTTFDNGAEQIQET